MLPPYATARPGFACNCNGQARKRNLSGALLQYLINLGKRGTCLYNVRLTLCNYCRKQFVFPAGDARGSQKVVLGFLLCPILSGLNPNWNVSTNFSEISPYQIWWKSVQPFSSCYMRTDGHTHTHTMQAICKFFTVIVTNALQTWTFIQGLSHSAPTDTCVMFYPKPHIVYTYAQDEPCAQASWPR
jgi:hypothetical protein